MDLMTCRVKTWAASISLLLLIGYSSMAMATSYVYTSTVGSGCTAAGLCPTFPCSNQSCTTGASQPPIAITTTGTQFSSGDSLEVKTGTMATASSSPIGYTVGITGTSSTPIGITLQVDSGATLSYNGSVSTGAAFFSSRADNSSTNNTTVNVNGTITSGTGLYAIYLANSYTTSPGPLDVYNINIGNTAVIDGAILSNGVYSPNISITGAPTINGEINLSSASNGISTLLVGGAGTATFTPTESIANLGSLHLTNTSTLNLGVTTSGIKAVTIDPGSVLNLTSSLVGVSCVSTNCDGNILNNGIFNIYSTITKTGNFTGTGINQVYEGASTGLTIDTANYTVASHYVVMTDENNYGNITLPNAIFAGGTTTFKVIYGTSGNSAGYFAGGTYTLVTATNGINTPTSFTSSIASSLFLTFGTPQVNGNTIQITLTRTPFTNYATTNLTQGIAANIEQIGQTTSPAQSFLNILDAIETSTTQTQVEYNLEQLAPLADAPFYGYIMQDDSLYQVKMRLASLHSPFRSYVAGDIGSDLHTWFRGFGSYANQKPREDSFGYYGSSGGIVVGLDHDLDDRYTLGAAFAYTLSHVKDKVNVNQSFTKFKTYTGIVYGTYNYSDVSYLDWVMSVGINNFNANRFIDINSLYIATATSAYSSQQISLLAVLGKNYEAFGFMQLTPEASIQYTFSKQYSYQESGAAGANLNISRKNGNVLSLAVGGIAAIPLFADPSIIMPEIHGWVFYDPIVGDQDTVFNFVTGGGPITSSFNIARTSLSIGTALTIAVIDKLEVKFNIDYDVADRFNGYVYYLNLRYTF